MNIALISQVLRPFRRLPEAGSLCGIAQRLECVGLWRQRRHEGRAAAPWRVAFFLGGMGMGFPYKMMGNHGKSWENDGKSLRSHGKRVIYAGLSEI